MANTFPKVSATDWRSQVDKELAGAPFESTLVHTTREGLEVLPLYSERPTTEPVDVAAAPFRVCVRIAAAGAEAVAEALDGGADALWLAGTEGGAKDLLKHVDLEKTFVLFGNAETREGLVPSLQARFPNGTTAPFALGIDPLASLVRGEGDESYAPRARLIEATKSLETLFPCATTALVSTLPYHDAGADAADELAIALATGIDYLRTLTDAGVSIARAARAIAFQLASGRETFAELCKLRAMRVTWRKVLVASGLDDPPPAFVHAVCSSRTLTRRDPWNNILRATTQTFSAALGLRIARNTGLVLREESALGSVRDPASGSYYFESLTDRLAREAWRRLQGIEREGGIEAALRNGSLKAHLHLSWQTYEARIRAGAVPILGVSEFANAEEKVLSAPPLVTGSEGPSSLPVHRDEASWETR